MQLAKKYGWRLCLAIFIFFSFRLNDSDQISAFFDFSPMLDKVLFGYTVVVVFLIWEVLDRAFAKLEQRCFNFTRPKNLVKATLILTMVTLPLVAGASLFSEYYLKPLLDCPVTQAAFYEQIFQGQVFGWLIISAKIIRINSVQNQKLEQDKALVQKELLQSKYQNLKNQINPHFLFNSFSVLQSLIESDPEKAGTFLEKLSAMYRNILEKREEAMSSVARELEVVDVYLYLLKTRHEDGLQVQIDIDKSYHQSFVPTLSLQMLIENAVKHNRFSTEQPLLIDVFVEDEYLVVKNRLKRRGAMAESTKVGLENIRNQYSLQTDKAVIVTQDSDFFTAKLPVLFGLRLT